jgi:general secretion pathway protein D
MKPLLSRLSPLSAPLRRTLTVLAAATVLATAAAALQAQPAESRGGSGGVTLNFTNAEIDAVARTIATITGRNVVVDPRVKGSMTLVTSGPIPPAQALRQFAAQLRTQGFALVESSGLYLVVPEAEAKLQGGTVSAGPVPAASGQIVTQIFRLNFETANNLVPVLRPLISPNNTINVNPGNNSLVITDYSDNLQRLARIIAALDVSNASDVEIIRLEHAIATDLAPLVTRLIESGGAAPAGGQGQADTSFKTTLVAEPRSNALILRAANPARVALVRSLVARLDQPASSGGGRAASGNIHVVYLKNADATKLATTLRAALAAEARTSTASTGATATSAGTVTPATTASMGTSSAASAALSPSAQPSTGGQIQADPATNSLIITAPEPQYRQLRAVIDQLDGRRAQVLVESLIVEVNAEKAAQFGIQWQGVLGNQNSSNIGLLGTNFSTGNTANIINLALQAASGAATPSAGGNLGVVHKTNGIYVLGFLANFLQTNGDGNVLSTPNLLTLDNEEAKIVIGENVPFVTGQYTNANVGSSGSVNPFTTVERKDVGLTLKVKPQINENGTVKLVIFQETSNVKSGTETALNGPTTTKRSIESTVLVEDGNIVVLGGLLQDQFAGNQDKVPVVGDVPFFGNLFRSEARSRKKTNLMVFLRPVVVRDAATTDSLSMDRYDLMRAIQKDAQPVQSQLVPINEAPVMAPLRPAQPLSNSIVPRGNTPAAPAASQ